MLVEKKVSLAVILAVVLESAGVLMWVGSTSEKLREVELKTTDQQDMAERLARVETHLELAAEQLSRIEKKLDETDE
jgi:hypothetical protein